MNTQKIAYRTGDIGSRKTAMIGLWGQLPYLKGNTQLTEAFFAFLQGWLILLLANSPKPAADL